MFMANKVLNSQIVKKIKTPCGEGQGSHHLYHHSFYFIRKHAGWGGGQKGDTTRSLRYKDLARKGGGAKRYDDFVHKGKRR